MSETGLEVSASASLTAALGGLTSEMRAERQWRQKMSQVLRQVPLAVPGMQLSAGAGTVDVAQALGPPQGYYWSIRRLTATGFTAGTVTAYIDSANGEPVAPFPQTGVFTFGRGEILLHPMSRLVIAATGITGTVQVYGAADAFEDWYLPYYLG